MDMKAMTAINIALRISTLIANIFFCFSDFLQKSETTATTTKKTQKKAPT